MKINTVAVSVRFSKALGDGQHKTVELSAEGVVEPRETWETAQAGLYNALGDQLNALWSGNGIMPTAKTATAPPTVERSAPPERHCQEHGQAFTRYEKNGRSWWAHRTQDGKWCNEKEKAH